MSRIGSDEVFDANIVSLQSNISYTYQCYQGSATDMFNATSSKLLPVSNLSNRLEKRHKKSNAVPKISSLIRRYFSCYDIAIGARGLGFEFRVDQVGHSVADDSPPLRRFFFGAALARR